VGRTAFNAVASCAPILLHRKFSVTIFVHELLLLNAVGLSALILLLHKFSVVKFVHELLSLNAVALSAPESTKLLLWVAWEQSCLLFPSCSD
jgi:hypothetical protein